MKFFNLFLLLAIMLFAAPTPQREQVDIVLKDMKIEDFLKMTAKILNQNILVTQDVRGEVNFISTNPIYKDEILSILIAVLETKGVTLVRDGRFLKTVKTSVASRENLPIVEKNSAGSLMVTQMMVVENYNVDVVVQKVRHLISNSAKLVTMKETNSLVLTDYPSNIETVTKVIKALSSTNEQQIEFIKLKYAKVLGAFTHISSITKTIVDQGAEQNKITVLKDDATNSLILIASKENIKKVKDIVEKLDVEEDFASQKMEVIPLKNSEAKGLAAIIGATIGKVTTPAQPPVAASKAIITAEEELNSLIVIATHEEIEEIKKLVAKLDIPRQQVYVKAKIVEVSEEQAEKIGLRYGIEAGGVGGNGLYSIGTQLTGNAIASNALASKMTLPANLDSAFMLGISLDFLETNGAAEVLSEPSILCVNNKESTIYVGETRSILTSTSQTTAGMPTNNYARQDIGLTLAVKPRLSTDKKVSLDVKATLEGVKADTGVGTPTTTKRNVTTTAIVNDGEEVIIGGLIKKDESGNRSKIPLLGDIPLLGALFRGDTSSSSKTNLVIILTPYIVESSADLPKLREKLTELDTIQKSYSKEVLTAIKEHSKIKEEEQQEGATW